MINGRDNIMLHLQEVQPRWWRLFDGAYAKNKFKMASYEEREGTQEESLAYLESILERCGPGMYTLHYTDSVANNKGPSWTAPMQVPFKIGRDNPASIGSQQGMGVQKVGYAPHEVQQMIQESVAQEKRFWDLERELADTKAAVNSKESTFERMLANENVQNFFANMVGQFMGPGSQQAAKSAIGYIGGPEGAQSKEQPECGEENSEVTEVEISEETNQRLAEVVNRLLPLFDMDQTKMMDKLEGLAEKAESNPGLIAML